MNDFLDGATMLAWLVAALHFRRFWLRTRDPLLRWFSRAFAVLAASRLALVIVGRHNELSAFVYVLRLVAFAFIIIGISARNRRPARREKIVVPAAPDHLR